MVVRMRPGCFTALDLYEYSWECSLTRKHGFTLYQYPLGNMDRKVVGWGSLTIYSLIQFALRRNCRCCHSAHTHNNWSARPKSNLSFSKSHTYIHSHTKSEHIHLANERFLCVLCVCVFLCLSWSSHTAIKLFSTTFPMPLSHPLLLKRRYPRETFHAYTTHSEL